MGQYANESKSSLALLGNSSVRYHEVIRIEPIIIHLVIVMLLGAATMPRDENYAGKFSI